MRKLSPSSVILDASHKVLVPPNEENTKSDQTKQHVNAPVIFLPHKKRSSGDQSRREMSEPRELYRRICLVRQTLQISPRRVFSFRVRNKKSLTQKEAIHAQSSLRLLTTKTITQVDSQSVYITNKSARRILAYPRYSISTLWWKSIDKGRAGWGGGGGVLHKNHFAS